MGGFQPEPQPSGKSIAQRLDGHMSHCQCSKRVLAVGLRCSAASILKTIRLSRTSRSHARIGAGARLGQKGAEPTWVWLPYTGTYGEVCFAGVHASLGPPTRSAVHRGTTADGPPMDGVCGQLRFHAGMATVHAQPGGGRQPI
jgi:hypothetical protein